MSTAKTAPVTPAKDTKVEAKKYAGIRGWLLFLAIVLSVGLVMNIIGFFDNISVLRDATSSVAFESYPELKTVLYFEIAVLAAAIVAGAFGLWLLYKRKKLAKVVIAGLMLGVVVTGLIDGAWLNSVLAGNTEALDAADNTRDLGRAVLGAVIWVPYLYMSKRVKQTLVNA